MRSKQNKISRQHFDELLRSGRSLHSPHVKLVYILNASDVTHNKYSFIISKKVAKKAVQRNKLKRRGYYIISKNKAYIKAQSVLFLFFKKGALDITFKELEDEITDLLRKAKLLK
ncbi:ribonuclease P protein component [Candidatus Wolfebacteria bacterium]|nr:MAG: ribonuclease P protein component [Candidatus Wolfebacteria bacterium]